MMQWSSWHNFECSWIFISSTFGLNLVSVCVCMQKNFDLRTFLHFLNLSRHPGSFTALNSQAEKSTKVYTVTIICIQAEYKAIINGQHLQELDYKTGEMRWMFIH